MLGFWRIIARNSFAWFIYKRLEVEDPNGRSLLMSVRKKLALGGL
jgi:hypothetical protein